MWHPCGTCRYCESCQGGFAPRRWRVVVAGLANRDPVECAECATLNGSYVLEPAGECSWQYTLPQEVCGVSHVRLWIGLDLLAPPRWAIVVELRDAVGTQLMLVQKNYTARPPCMSLIDEPLGALWVPWSGGPCDFAQSQVVITALRSCRDEGLSAAAAVTDRSGNDLAAEIAAYRDSGQAAATGGEIQRRLAICRQCPAFTGANCRQLDLGCSHRRDWIWALVGFGRSPKTCPEGRWAEG
jgi:hypothetical protein